MKVIQTQVCCQKGICTPQYEITFQEFEYKSRLTPSPTIQQEIFKSFAVEGESQMSSQDTCRQLKLEQALIYAKKLRLEIISSSTMKKNTEFIITTVGSEQTCRGVKDGFVYFGCKKGVYVEGKKQVVNDIVFPVDEKNLAEKHRGQHFCIFYDLIKDSYVIKDFSIGFGTFVKVSDMVVIRDNYLLFMGEHYLLFNLSPDEALLRVKLLGPPSNDKVYEYYSQDYIENCVKIGRGGFCDIIIEDSLASKVQCCINFNSRWVLVDGDGDKSSTNGVWLYLSEPLEIVHGMFFKANHTVFQVTLF